MVHLLVLDQIVFDGVAVVIFVTVALTYLFPCNCLIPLDRRTISVAGALFCYLTRKVLFSNREPLDLIKAVNFDVLILLPSIMVVNYLIVHSKETKQVVHSLQRTIQRTPVTGLWMVSVIAFVSSPFLTNDGICLLFVEPILLAFSEVVQDNCVGVNKEVNTTQLGGINKLQENDVVYFLLALACSANIGSTLTYTGNPQNMIIASDAISVMPSYKFLVYMLAPSIFSWLISK